MMKNKKLIIVFILVIAFLLMMVNFTKATDDVGQLPTISTGNNPSNQNQANEPINAPTNTPAPITGNNATSGNTLPQTGVAGDTALFVFIGVCVVSAVYAYFRIKKYNNLH